MTRARIAGFSSLEVLIGISLFSVVAAGLAVTTIGSTKSNATSRDVVSAYTLITSKVEEFRTNPATADLTEGTHVDPGNPMTARGLPGGPFTRRWVVTHDVPKPGLAEVVLTVSWKNNGPRVATAVAYACITTSCS